MTAHGTFVAIALILSAQQQPPAQPVVEPAPATSQPTVDPRNPTQAEIYRELLREEERPTRILPSDPGRAEAASSATTGPRAMRNSTLILEGTLIVDRPGRLLLGESSSMFRFATSDDVRFSRPLALNKNGLLEAMEREAEMGADDFFITANVARYRGENYLTLLKYRRQVPHGNLSP